MDLECSEISPEVLSLRVCVRSHIGWRGKRSIAYKGVETSPYQTCFKTLKGSTEGKAQRGQYLLAVDLGCYPLDKG